MRGTRPIAKLQKIPCSGPGELLHINFTTIEETIGLHEEPVVRNVLIMQDHFSKHVVAYVVKDQKVRTAAEALHHRFLVCSELQPTYLVTKENHSPPLWWRTFVNCMVSRSLELPHIMLKPMDKWSV